MTVPDDFTGTFTVRALGLDLHEPVTAERITNAVGADKLAVFAETAGTSPEAIAAHLAEQLPIFIDTINPNGQATEEPAVIARAVAAFNDSAPYDAPALTMDSAPATRSVGVSLLGVFEIAAEVTGLGPDG